MTPLDSFLERYLKEHGREKRLAIDCLYALQGEFHRVEPSWLQSLAKAFELEDPLFRESLRFFPLLSASREALSVCVGLPCYLAGQAENLKKLAHPAHPVPCLQACHLAPCVAWQERILPFAAYAEQRK